MIEEDRYCMDISNQLQATQALLKSVNQDILQAHIRNCVREALQTNARHDYPCAKHMDRGQSPKISKLRFGSLLSREYTRR